MYTQAEATKERTEAYVVALEHEKEGYKARIAALAAGKRDRLDKEQLTALVKGVDAEIARVKRLKPKDDAPEDDDAS